MYEAADLRKGLKIEMDGEPYIVTEFDFCKGKGQALYRCKLKNMISGGTTDRTFRSWTNRKTRPPNASSSTSMTKANSMCSKTRKPTKM